MRFCSLSSCSTYGNAYLVESRGGTRVLFDCGLPLRRLERALDGVGAAAPDLHALFLSHDHADHTRALFLRHPFPVRYGIPVYATPGLWQRGELNQGAIPGALRRTYTAGAAVRVGDLAITPLRTPHDATESHAFLIDDGEATLAVCTDLGHVPDAFFGLMSGLGALVFECNHDVEMERRAAHRPWHVKQRTLGAYGHLSNEQAAAALSRLVTADTRVVLLAHLSLDCNLPELALQVTGQALHRAGWSGTLAAAPYGDPSPFYSVRGGERPALVQQARLSL